MTLEMQQRQRDEKALETGTDWTSEGVTIPDGSDAKMTYMRGQQEFFGRFVMGKLIVDGKKFDTLSQAASALALNRRGRPAHLNGWAYWHVRLPGSDEWIAMATLKKAAEKSSGSARS
jgi:hypothetical protein